jgi:hypothetical protein
MCRYGLFVTQFIWREDILLVKKGVLIRTVFWHVRQETQNKTSASLMLLDVLHAIA